MDERVASAAKFLLQSPPGEINDVLNDVRNIIADDNALQGGIQPALRQYNVEQFVTVDVPGQRHQVIISEIGRVEGEDERFRDPRSKTTFKFDHLRLVRPLMLQGSGSSAVEQNFRSSVQEASDPQPYEPDEAAEPFRAALESAALTYIADHFVEGVATVYASSSTQYVIQFVANKYNPLNYWSGRWRSEYMVNISEGKLFGKVLINVHYFEQGNVQLCTTYAPSFDLSSAVTSSLNTSSASKILALIEARETEHQAALNDTYHEMAEKTFKGLRRALPLTRQKLDWDKVLGYKLGQELTASKGAFAG